MSKLMSQNTSEIVQIIINISYFCDACSQFEKMLTDRKFVHKAGGSVLGASAHFRETRTIATKRICAIVNIKIDSFLEGAGYDWAPKEKAETASPWLQGIFKQ